MKVLFVLLLIPISFPALAQKSKVKESFYVLDDNWEATTVEKASYFVRKKKLSDSAWQSDAYHIWGPLISTETFKDEAMAIAHGRSTYYNAGGKIDSIGHYNNGVAHGSWSFYNNKGKVTLKKEYVSGVLKQTFDSIQLDSIAKKAKDNTIASSKEIESEFPGGLSSWQRYLSKNLRFPKRALDARIQGTVVVEFIVDADGNISEPRIYKSVEYSLDEEALRMIRLSSKWVPAVKDGSYVKSYKRQPITFRFY